MSMRRALVFSYLEKYGSFVVGLASTIVISRLLGPADIGVFAVGMALVGIVAVVRELGISTYIVQEPELTPARIRAAFTMTAGVGFVLAFIVLLLSFPAGSFYGDPRVTSIIAVLSLGFALTPLGSVSQALLSREMRFGVLTWIRLGHAVISSSVAIALVLLGYGPVGLAWGTVTAAALNGGISMLIRPHTMRPSFHAHDLRRVFAVGGPATVIAIIEDILGAIPELLLGRLQGLPAAGLFSRARGLSQLSHQLIARAAGPVFLAAFAEQRRAGASPAEFYLKANACVTALGWTILVALAVLADPVVAVLFGPMWTGVVPILRWLCLAAALALLTSGINHLLFACGASRDMMLAKLASLPVFAACLAAGGLVNAEAAAAATAVATALSGTLLCRAVKHSVGISWAQQLSPLWLSGPIAIAGGIGASAGLFIAPASTAGALASVALGGVACCIAALVIVMLGSHPLRSELTRFYRNAAERL